MATKLHDKGFEHAKKMVEDGKVTADDQGNWSKHQPDTDAENAFIEENGIEEFGKWHLGIDPDDEPENKGYYKFPYGDFKKVHRDGLIAVKQRAGEYDYDDILKAGDKLLEMIEEKDD